MKTIKMITLFSIAVVLSACNLGGTNNTYKYFNFNNFFINKNNNISVECRYNFADENDTFVISQNKSTYVWYEDNNTYDLSVNSENISYVDNKVIIKDNSGNILYEDILPTIEDIEQATGIALPKALIEYKVLKTNNSIWDRESIIASVGINKSRDKNLRNYIYPILYTFSLVKEDSNWNIGYISKDGNYNSFGDPFLSLFVKSTDEKASICDAIFFKDTYCFSREGNIIKRKKLFGEIYNEKYLTTINKYQEAYVTPIGIYYFFDSNNNMHLFYNDTEQAEGKYFYYAMFTEDEPTVPKYEQKIEKKK